MVVFVDVALLEGNLLYRAYLGQRQLEVIQYLRGYESVDLALPPPFSTLRISAFFFWPFLRIFSFSSLLFPAARSSCRL